MPGPVLKRLPVRSSGRRLISVFMSIPLTPGNAAEPCEPGLFGESRVRDGRSGMRLAEACEFVIVLGLFGQKIDDAHIFRIHKAGLGIAFLDAG